jgi:trigger factor
VPGYRPGKAPKELIKKQNAQRINAAALEKVVIESINEALRSNNINALGQPDVKNVNFDEEGPITFTAYVDVFPEFTVEKYSGFSFDRVLVKATDKDVDDTVGRLTEQMVEYKAVDARNDIKNGDRTIIDFEGKVDGVPFEGGKAENHTLDIGSGQFIPGFEEGMIGLKKGETGDVPVKFPDDYNAADLAGKDAVFTVKIHEIQEKIAPELNDDFAKKASTDRANTMAELRDLIRKDLQFESDQFTKFDTFTRILNKLIEENNFEVPSSIVKEQAERLASQNLQQYYQMGINPEMFGLTPQGMAPQFMGEAEMQVKRALVINALAKQFEITVSDEDMDKEMSRLATQSGRDEAELKAQIMMNPQSVQGLRNDLLSEKVYEKLVTENTINDSEMTREEFEEKRRKDAEEAEKSETAEEEKPKKKGGRKKKADAEVESEG